LIFVDLKKKMHKELLPLISFVN